MAGGFNGSGTYTLPESAFVPNTPISSSAMNSNLSSIATDGLSLVVCKDGQTTITGAFKGFAGTVAAPMYAFSADPDSGMYRIGANNVGIAAGGTKILDIATTGLAVTGTLTTTGGYSPTGQILAADGTVALPEYSFTADPDSGIYRIGANNIGIGVNATKILDISTSGLNVIGTVSSNGAAFSPTAQAAGMVNGTIVESHTGNAMTLAIKTLAGTDPSASDIVYFVFRSATAATGNYTVIQITAALSITVSSGSTLGVPATASTPFRLWLVAFNDAGTVRLGIINNVSGINIYPLGQFPIASSTAEGGVGGADSAQVFYTGAAVASKAYSILGYASYESGLAVAGSWAASPTRLQLFDIGVPLPGTPFPTVQTQDGAVNTGSTLVPNDDTKPQVSEGNGFLSQAITQTSNANLLFTEALTMISANNAQNVMVSSIFHNTDVDSIATVFTAPVASASIQMMKVAATCLAGSTSPVTMSCRSGGDQAATFTFNGLASARKFGGSAGSFIRVTELMT